MYTGAHVAQKICNKFCDTQPLCTEINVRHVLQCNFLLCQSMICWRGWSSNGFNIICYPKYLSVLNYFNFLCENYWNLIFFRCQFCNSFLNNLMQCYWILSARSAQIFILKAYRLTNGILRFLEKLSCDIVLLIHRDPFFPGSKKANSIKLSVAIRNKLLDTFNTGICKIRWERKKDNSSVL